MKGLAQVEKKLTEKSEENVTKHVLLCLKKQFLKFIYFTK